MVETTAGGFRPAEEIAKDLVKSDGERLLDAQLLIGMIERYRPGTAREARAWFADLLQKGINHGQ